MPITSRGKGYPIPDNPEPEGYYCVRVYVPHDQLYMGIFWQSLHYLASPRAWANDVNRTAITAAEVWRAALQKSQEVDVCGDGDCGIMDIRQKPDVPCIVQKLDDCTDEWVDTVNMSLCVPRMRMLGGVIQQETSPGVWEDAGDPDTPFDDRTDGAYTPAWESPPPGEDGACLAAANAVEYLAARVQAICYANRDYLEWLTWFSVLVAALALLAGVGLVLVLLAGALITLVDTYLGDWGDAGDYDFRDDIKCFIMDSYDATGVMSVSAWEQLQLWLTSEAYRHANDYERVAINLSKVMVWALGPVGMTRLANFAGIDSDDCTSCEWLHVFDLRDGLGEWEIQTYLGQLAGDWVHGVGVRGVYSGVMGTTGSYKVYINHDSISSTEFIRGGFAQVWDEAEGYYHRLTLGVYASGILEGNLLNVQAYDPPGPQLDRSYYDGEGTYTGDELRAEVVAIHLGLPTPTPGDVGGLTVEKVYVWGTGSDPF